MRLGVTIPQSEIEPDVGGLHELCQGANVASRSGWSGPYGHTDLWHEPMVLFGYLAGVTQELELATSILILPQIQTSLVAKQAAEVDVLSGGPGSVGNTADIESDRVLRRIARMADGWFPSLDDMGDCRAAAARLHEYARQEGRNPGDVAIQGSVSAVDGTPDSWVQRVREWRDLGATHISARIGGAGLTSVQHYVEVLARFRDAVSDAMR